MKQHLGTLFFSRLSSPHMRDAVDLLTQHFGCKVRLSMTYVLLVIGMVAGFIEHLYTQLVTTSNYSAVANSHILQFITAHT
jgi:hypothetical protein